MVFRIGDVPVPGSIGKTRIQKKLRDLTAAPGSRTDSPRSHATHRDRESGPMIAGMRQGRLPAPDSEMLPGLLHSFGGVSLEDIQNSGAELLARREKKFLLSFRQCLSVMSGLSGSYRALEINGSRIGRYTTRYLDTDSFMTYLWHHNGKAHRYKLRFRHYYSTSRTFLEVKERQNTGRTIKRRIETYGIPDLSEKDPAKFLKSNLSHDCSGFHPVLETDYWRVCLVSADMRERITFDLCLSFRNDVAEYSYPSVVVGEIKYDRDLFRSAALAGLKDLGVRKTPFSKYCIGVTHLYPGIKHNRFRPLVSRLEKLSTEGAAAC